MAAHNTKGRKGERSALAPSSKESIDRGKQPPIRFTQSTELQTLSSIGKKGSGYGDGGGFLG